MTGLTTEVFPKNDHVLFSEVFFLKTGYQQDVICDVTVGFLYKGDVLMTGAYRQDEA